MADFQLLGCSIALGGGKETIVVRNKFHPVSYPEFLVLQFLHGDDAVTDATEVGTVTMPNNDMLHHLQLTYPKEAIQQCFPGARPNLPTRSDEFPKSRDVLMEAQAARTPGPGPSTENMKVPAAAPKRAS